MSELASDMPPGAPSGEPGHILVVDDNDVNREVLTRRLTRRGHSVKGAVNGRHALDMMAAHPFDLVLLDIMMPVLNGYQVLEHVRGDEGLRHIPIILISALDDTESLIEGIKKGADDHLPKPFNTHILHARVDACLAKKRLRDREQLHARALAREIDIAREIQAGFLPEDLPAPTGWELDARIRPALSVAGDFYDAFRLEDGRRIAIVVADVCGKGVGAALFMALFRTLLRSLSDRFLSTGGRTEEEVLRLVGAVNDYIATTHGRANMFATLFLAIVDPATGGIVYVNGGHEAPVITGPEGIAGILAPTGPAVGMFPEMVFTAGRTTLAPGQTLVVFTDGVTDALAGDGSQFSLERLLGLLEGPAGSAAGMLDRIEAAVREHIGESPPFDDITLFAARRHG